MDEFIVIVDGKQWEVEVLGYTPAHDATEHEPASDERLDWQAVSEHGEEIHSDFADDIMVAEVRSVYDEIVQAESLYKYDFT